MNNLDLFKQRPFIRVNKYEFISSNFSKFCTLLMLLIVINYTIFQSIKIDKKYFFNISSLTKLKELNTSITFSNQNNMFAFYFDNE